MEQSSQSSPNEGDMGSLDRFDALDDYFMINSPLESPNQSSKRTTGVHPASVPSSPVLDYGYYAESGTSAIAAHQENVKFGTSNISVDRSNATRPHQQRYYSIGDSSASMPAATQNRSSDQKGIDDLLKLETRTDTVDGINLSELFLKPNHRNSVSQNYQAMGKLKSHDKDLHRARSHSLDGSFLSDQQSNNATNNRAQENQDDSAKSSHNASNNKNSTNNPDSSMDLNLDDVLPTPLAEIRAKSEQRHRQLRQHQDISSSHANESNLTAQRLDQHHYHIDRQSRAQHGNNYYPFGRSYQLPIPTITPVSPPTAHPQVYATKEGESSMVDPVATAAALAVVQRGGGSVDNPTNAVSTNPNATTSAQIHAPSQPAAAAAAAAAASATSDQHAMASNDHSSQQPASQYNPHQSSQHYQTQNHLATPLAVGAYPPPGPKIVGPYTTAQQERTANSNSLLKAKAAVPAPASNYLPRRGDHTSRDSSLAHTTPKGILQDAARQRSGYSGYHKPATSQTTNNYHHPLPAKFASYPSSAAGPPKTIYANQPTQATSSDTKASVMPPSMSQSQDFAPQTADTAYERKKQRAKDARVKLNESIERLHVSMSVAGTESKRRTDQLRNFMKQAGRSTETTTDHQAFQLMESCVKTAESAKKWDRPNFVGSAATMIQCLNSQCEILMKELSEYQNGTRTFTTATKEPPQPEITNGKRSPGVSETTSANQAEIPDKRQRLNGEFHQNGDEKKDDLSESVETNRTSPVEVETTPTTTTILSVSTPQGSTIQIQLEGRITNVIAAFLDPGSILQCLKVCKGWSGKNGSFRKPETWTNLCVKRFGYSRVRQWQENHSHDDKDGADHTHLVTGMTLYRRMHHENVMPPLQFDGGGRQTLLGASRLGSGGVAAWMFLVERSNGETMRSVKRNPDERTTPRSAGLYASLPVVELRLVIQNTGGMTPNKFGKRSSEIIIKEQCLTIDASTRRKGGELSEISWDTDGRFDKKFYWLDGSPYERREISKPPEAGELVRLELFESIVMVAYMHAQGCSTTTKFVQRSNFMKVLATVNGTTQPIVIPFINQLI